MRCLSWSRGVLALAILSLPSGARGAELPQYVKGPISGQIYDCQQAKQRAPPASAYVTSSDLDGDGQPDFVVDLGRGCKSNRDLYCNDEGCTIDVYLSSQSGLGLTMKARSFRVVKDGTRNVLEVIRGGAACAGLPGGVCVSTFVYDGKEQLVPKR